MPSPDQLRHADAFLALHREGTFVLPNAWDPGSAVLVEQAGAPAIATTSSGISWSLARPDGQGLSQETMVERVGQMVAAVDIPVSADLERGYGDDPEAVTRSIRDAIAVGVVGVNLEDSLAVGGPLFGIPAQVARLQAARSAAVASGLPNLVINARTDVYLFEIGDPIDRLDDLKRRADAFAGAGADCLFVPGVLDLGLLAEIVHFSPLPINVLAGPGAPSVGDLREIGVRRISVGGSIAQAAYTLVRRAATEMVTRGTFDTLGETDGFASIDGAFSRQV